jgi:hypothetical protein
MERAPSPGTSIDESERRMNQNTGPKGRCGAFLLLLLL